MDDELGFNSSKITKSIGDINSAYADLTKALYNSVQEDYVNAMADLWYCPQAKRVFTSEFKPRFDALLSESLKIFKSVVDAMNSAASEWASKTEASYSNVEFTGQQQEINVGSIKEELEGNQGVRAQSAQDTTDSVLNQVQSSADQALDAAVTAVNDCGFLGGGQAEQLESSLNEIKDNVSEAISEVKDKVTEAIEETVEVYGNVAEAASDAFAGE